MLITTILSALGLSVISDGKNRQDDGEYYKQNTMGRYTIFEWDDGMCIQRDLIDGAFYCGFQKFLLIHISDSNVRLYASLCILPQERSYNVGIIKQHISERIAWLMLKYFGHASIDDDDPNFRLRLPVLHSEQHAIAEKGAPDRVDPYELTVYQTGQMDKSMFTMSQEDFLETIGKN